MTNSRKTEKAVEISQPASNQPLWFYSAWYCPFAQRAWMALLHKGLDFEYIEVDPYRESTWWRRISRNRTKVPVIISPPGNTKQPTTVINVRASL